VRPDAQFMLTQVADPRAFGFAELEAVAALKSSWRDELEITEAIQWLLDNSRPVRSTSTARGSRHYRGLDRR
jgi:glucose-1-phosphate thymidylyltransferase